jgi:hypothetical protein
MATVNFLSRPYDLKHEEWRHEAAREF